MSSPSGPSRTLPASSVQTDQVSPPSPSCKAHKNKGLCFPPPQRTYGGCASRLLSGRGPCHLISEPVSSSLPLLFALPGKSNLMDAVSFVVGVNTTTLRGTRLADFRSNLSCADDRPTSVTLFYHTPAGKNGHVDETQFTRTITVRDTSEYRIDGKKVDEKEYQKRLTSVGLLVKSRNFLVFQVGPPQRKAAKRNLGCLAFGSNISPSHLGAHHSAPPQPAFCTPHPLHPLPLLKVEPPIAERSRGRGTKVAQAAHRASRAHIWLRGSQERL